MQPNVDGQTHLVIRSYLFCACATQNLSILISTFTRPIYCIQFLICAIFLYSVYFRPVSDTFLFQTSSCAFCLPLYTSVDAPKIKCGCSPWLALKERPSVLGVCAHHPRQAGRERETWQDTTRTPVARETRREPMLIIKKRGSTC